MNQIEIKLFGRVQGIGFRKKIKKFVLNKNLKEFVLWLKTNPGFSFINNVKESWSISKEEYSGFNIHKNYPFLEDKIKSFFNLGKYFLNNKNVKIPVHVAIIPDGNRRWAKNRFLDLTVGYKKASNYNFLFSLFEEARYLGIKVVSIWGFSTENWKRNDEEKKVLFDLILQNIQRARKDSEKNKIRFKHIGRSDRLPKKLLSGLKQLEEETKNYHDFSVLLCLDYGGRDEILRAVNQILRDKKKKINEKEFLDYLDSKNIPDVDLIIRTSGEKRTSGFMPFNSVYSELIFINKFFPSFNKKDLKKAVKEFGKRKRRFGK